MMRKISFIISMISFVLSLLVFTLFLTNQEKPLTRIFKESLSSVVEVRAYTADLESFGTAVILSNGKLVTNFHIISYTNQSKTYVHNNIEIRFSDSEIYQNVEIKHYDVNLDLAMLELTKIQGKSFEVNIAEIFTGQKIFLMGNGNNLGISLTIYFDAILFIGVRTFQRGTKLYQNSCPNTLDEHWSDTIRYQTFLS
ncbi:MAG: hypothetical protein RBR50_10530 [Candidatus Izemoplasmatales bacterium]|nr:hypothetical protein [Candidatus Izemoplasmatales bacterium]